MGTLMYPKMFVAKIFGSQVPQSDHLPTITSYIHDIIPSCLDEPSSSGDISHGVEPNPSHPVDVDVEEETGNDVSHGVEPSHPVDVEAETGNQVATEITLEPGALELYRPESQMSESATDDLHKSILKSGMVI